MTRGWGKGWGKDGGSIVSDAFFCSLGLVFLAWVLATTLFVGNVLALFSVLFIWPINRAWHDGFLDKMAGVGWGSIVDYIEHVGRLSPVITGELEALGAPDHPFHKGNKIVLSNHATAGDPLALFVVGHRLRRIGSMRFMVKKVLLLFPILGLAAYFLNFVFLSRTWTKDEGAIRKVFRSMIEGARKRSKVFWICLFPEGTRLTPAKLQKSQEYAASKNLPHLKHLLIPRIKGLQATLVGLRQDVDAVLDLTIAYSVRQGQMPVQGGGGGGGAAAGAGGIVSGHLANHFKIRPSMGDLILRRSAACSWPVHIHVRILPVSQIPEDEAGISEWALELFKQKDILLEHFNTHGYFPGEPNRLSKSPGHRVIRGAMIYSLTALGGAALLSILGGWSTCMYFYGSVYAVTVLHLYFELGGDLNLGIGDQHN